MGETREDTELSDSRTARLCREVANTILPNSVIMEEDSPSKHSGGKIPILDMEMWVNLEGYIVYQHYSKPMSSRSVIMARSAFPTSMKKNILIMLLKKHIHQNQSQDQPLDKSSPADQHHEPNLKLK